MNKTFVNLLEIVFFIFVLIVGMVFIISSASALENTIVSTELTLEFTPAGNCTLSCNNVTEGNTTTEVCTNICSGVLKVTGENVLDEFVIGGDAWAETIENNVIRNLGNDSDVTEIVNKMNVFLEYEEKYNSCLNSNRNLSVKFLMMEDDVGYKENYTECISSKDKLQNSVDFKTTQVNELKKELDRWGTDKWLWVIGGAILGLIGHIAYLNKDKFKTRKDKTLNPHGEY